MAASLQRRDAGSAPSRAQRVKGSGVAAAVVQVADAARIWRCRELWCRPAATAPIRPLAWEPPCAAGVALKRPKKKILISSNPQILFSLTEKINYADLFRLGPRQGPLLPPGVVPHRFFYIPVVPPFSGVPCAGDSGSLLRRAPRAPAPVTAPRASRVPVFPVDRCSDPCSYNAELSHEQVAQAGREPSASGWGEPAHSLSPTAHDGQKQGGRAPQAPGRLHRLRVHLCLQGESVALLMPN